MKKKIAKLGIIAVLTFALILSSFGALPFGDTFAKEFDVGAANETSVREWGGVSHSKLGASSNQLTAQAATAWNGTTKTAPTGTGASDNPYLIGTAEQLAYVADKVNTVTDYSKDKFFKLTANIELNVTTGWASWTDKTAGLNAWTPIGTIANPFKGTFDGNGKTVSGIYISGSADNQGLFGKTYSTATLQNVGVINSYIKGNENVGGVVGMNNSSKVINCHNTGKIDASGFNVGGVVGQNYYGSVINCYNSGEVTGKGNRVGGVVGYNNLGGKVINCYNLGSVKGYQYIGGVVGWNNGDSTVKNCYNSGNVTGDYYLGGVTGNNASGGTVECCYFLQNTTVNVGLNPNGSGSASSCATFDDTRKLKPVGGSLIISGKETLFEALNEGARVYNEGNKSDPNSIVAAPWATDSSGNTTHTEPEKKPGEVFTGGDGSVATPYLIATADQLKYLAEQVNKGNTECNAKNYKLTADIVLNAGTPSESTPGANPWAPIGKDDTNAFLGTFDGQGHTVSGIYINAPDDGMKGLFGVVGSYSALDATVKNVGVINSYIKGKTQVGGVAGLNKGKVINCYNTGAVNARSNNGGGVVGQNVGKLINCYNSGVATGIESFGGVVGLNNDEVINCYNTGSVTSTGDNVGGIVGFNNGSVTNCYNSGAVGGVTDKGGVVGENANSGTVTNCYFLQTNDINKLLITVGAGNKEEKCGTFNTTGALSGSIIDEKTTLIDALNFGYKKYNGAVPAPKIKIAPWIAVGGGYPTFTAAPTPITPADKCAGGNGTKEDPYLIGTAEQLAYMAQGVNAGNLNYSHFKLTADIELNTTTNWTSWETTPPEHCWTPIGIQNRQFKGTFDGDGHTVSGIYIGGGIKIGLFGETGSGATIKNVGVINSYIEGTGIASTTGGVGGVVGENKGKVINCYNSGIVNGLEHIGGVVGDNTEYGKVINCYNSGAIGTKDKSYGIGGVAGANDGALINCYNLGAVSGKWFIGGVVGTIGSAFNGTVTNCYNSGAVIGDNVIGGVAGQFSDGDKGVLTNCYNSGAVTGTQEIVGGVVGHLTKGTVANCYFLTGKITINNRLQSQEEEKAAGYIPVAPQIPGTLTNCSAFDASKKLTTVGSITPNATNKALVMFKQDADLLATLNLGVKAYNGVNPAPEILAAKWYTDADADGNPSLKAIVEIVTTPENKAIYANGRAITLKAVSGHPELTNIYYNEDLNTPIVLAGLTATNGGYDLSEYTVYGGGETATTGKTSVTMTDGKVKNIYGGGNGAAATVGGTKNITISGGTITGNVFGGDVGNKAIINISGAPAIGTAAGTSPVTPATGIIINGGSVANGVDSFVINGNLSGAANSINLVLPKGFVAKTVATKTSGITAEVAKFALVGEGSNKKTLAITENELKVETNLKTVVIDTNANAPAIYDGSGCAYAISGTDRALGNFVIAYRAHTDIAGTAYDIAAAPINAGSYDVKITRDEDADYAAFEATIANGTVINQLVAALEWKAPENLAFDEMDKEPTAIVRNLATQGKIQDICDVTVAHYSGDNYNEGGVFDFRATELSNPNYRLPTDCISPEYTITAKVNASSSDSSGGSISGGAIFNRKIENEIRFKNTNPVVADVSKHDNTLAKSILDAINDAESGKVIKVIFKEGEISITKEQLKGVALDKKSYTYAELKALLEVKPEVTPTPTPTPTEKPTEPVVPEKPATNLTWLWILLAVIVVAGAVVAFVVIKRKKK